MPLKGDLKSIELSSIFQLLTFNQKEGALKVKELEGKKRERFLYFCKSGVTILFGPKECGQLSEFLLNRGDLLPSELKKIRQSYPDEPKGFIEGLRFLEREVEGIGKFIEEELFDLFFWNNITFEFTEGSLGAEINGGIFPEHLFFPMDSIVMEAARRVDEWEAIKERIPPEDEIFVRREGDEGESADEIEKCVLSLIDGVRNVSIIADLSGIPRVDVYRALITFQQQGRIRTLTQDELKQGASKCIQENLTEDGIRLYRKAISGNPDDGELHELLAKLYERQGEHQKALNHYRAVGTSFLKRGAVEEAFKMYLHCLKLVPLDVASLAELVRIGLDHEELCKKTSFSPGDQVRTLVQIYRTLGRNQDAIDLLRKAIAKNLAPFDLRKDLIHALLDEEQKDLAVEEYKILGICFARRGDIEGALKSFTKALTLDGSREDIRKELTALQSQVPKVKARCCYAKFKFVAIVTLLIAGGCYLFYVLKADSLFQKIDIELLLRDGKFEEAREKLKEFARSYPLNPIRSKAMRALERVENEAARREASQKPEDPALAEEKARKLYQEALADVERGNLEEALGKFKDVLSQSEGKLWIEKEQVKEKERQLADYLRKASLLLEEGKRMEEWGQIERAFNFYKKLMEDYSLFCKGGSLLFPFLVESTPKGATIFRDGKSTLKATPAVLHLSRDEKAKILLQKEGFAGKEVTLSVEQGWCVKAFLDKHPSRVFDMGKAVLGCPAFSQDTLFVACEDGHVKAMEFTREDLKWDRELSVSDVESGIVRDGNRLFVGSKDSYIYALDERTGDCVWKFKTGGFITGTPAVKQGILYAGSMDGKVYAVEIERGERLWIFEGKGGFASSPVVEEESIYIGSTGGNLYRLDRMKGTLVQEFPQIGPIYSSLSVSNGLLYAGSDDGFLYAFSLEDGKLAWKCDAGDKIRTSPQTSRGRVYFGADNGRLFCLDSKFGKELSCATFGKRIRSSPLIIEGTLYFGSGDGYLYAVSSSDLSLKWKALSRGEAHSSPSMFKSRVYIASDGGFLQEFKE